MANIGFEVADGLVDEAFQRAADRVAASAASLSKDQQLALYGLYKQATCGICKDFRPSFFDVKARSKWAAWKNLDDMPQDVAKLEYTGLVDGFLPETSKSGGKALNRGTIGPVVSTLKDEDEEAGAAEMGSLHLPASQGEVAKVEEMLGAGSNIDERDTDGCCALHWAADRGHVEVARLLLERGANLHVADSDGQTPLHYAALCNQPEVVKLLLQSGADPKIRDREGQTAAQVATKATAECFRSRS